MLLASDVVGAAHGLLENRRQAKFAAGNNRAGRSVGLCTGTIAALLRGAGYTTDARGETIWARAPKSNRVLLLSRPAGCPQAFVQDSELSVLVCRVSTVDRLRHHNPVLKVFPDAVRANPASAGTGPLTRTESCRESSRKK